MSSLPARNPALAGALAALGAVFLFSVNDMTIKALSGGYALHQVILLRSFMALIVLLFIAVPLSGGFGALRTRAWGLHAARGLAVVVSNFAFFMGLAALPLAEGVAIFFVCPLIITALSVVFLGEKVGPRRWAAVAVGLIGVLIIVRPGAETFRAAALLPILAALSYATLQVLTRRYGRRESAVMLSLTLQVTFIAVSALSGLLFGDGQLAGSRHPSVEFLLRAWIWPPLHDLPVFLAMGLASGLGGFLIAFAYRDTDASVVATFEYLSMPLALIWGLVVFGEWPDSVALAGIALILGAGLFVAWREARVAR